MLSVLQHVSRHLNNLSLDRQADHQKRKKNEAFQYSGKTGIKEKIFTQFPTLLTLKSKRPIPILALF